MTLTVSVVGWAHEIPRMKDGRPDLRGIWQTISSAVWNIEDHPAELGIPAGHGNIDTGKLPYREDAIQKRKENFSNRLTEDPEAKCFMVGVPRITYMPYPFQIMQTNNQVTILYEYIHTFRNIYLDSDHPPGPIQWWMGDSRAHWEGDTLVVDVIHFTDQTWFDRSGNYHSEDLHVTERYTLSGPDHILYAATIEDPKIYSEPWTVRMPLYRRKEDHAQILEYECYAYMEMTQTNE
ncbi:MAG: hypothetical protein CMM56_02390 [Rhodospirillaceae bacterium]|nr:hypothetical protein [Rhodospirillaceae bacterium]